MQLEVILERRRHFLLEEQHENVVAAMTTWEMQGENERQWKKVNELHVRHFLQKNV